MTKAVSFLFYGPGENYDTVNEPEFEPVFEVNPTPEEEVSTVHCFIIANGEIGFRS